MSDSSTYRWKTVVVAALWLAIVGLGVAEWTMPEAARLETPLPDPSGEAQSVRNLYGWTAVDVGLIAGALAARTDEHRYIVAGYPGPERLNGPLLTRTTASQRNLAGTAADTLEARDVGAGWQQLTIAEQPDRPRTPLLSAAEVSVERDGERRLCPRLALERFACAPPGWSHVRRIDLTVGGRDVSCIWSHPLEDRTIVLDFGRIEARPDAGPYRLRTALDDKVAEEPGRAAVDVDIRLGDRTIDHRHRPKKGWQTSPPIAVEGAAPLTVTVSADEVGRRHFCFQIE